MAEKKRTSAGLIAAYAALLAMIVLAAALGVYMSNLNAQEKYIASLTPTPTPAYPDSVMQITPDPAAPTREPVLRTGSTGQQVIALQTRLIELGYLTGEADGQFGPATEAAVIRFQQQHGLAADGKVGSQTNQVLNSSSAQRYTVTPAPTATPAPARTSAPTSTPALTGTEKLQARLKELGYYSGEVDGDYGPATKAAVRSFQQAHGLAADGIAGPATNAVLYTDSARPFTTPVPGSEPWVRADGLPLLVNSDHHLPDGYRTSELVLMRTYCDDEIVIIKGSEIEGERVAVDALMAMLRAAHADGLTSWQISAGYRSVSYQQTLFNKQVDAYMADGMTRTQARNKTRQTVADPGASEHHTGLAFDVTVPGQQFSNTRQSTWLAQHCWEYGFIIRYPIDKVNITGISYEPWHIRYVGVEHAIRMRDENLCLEEYIDKYGN